MTADGWRLGANAAVRRTELVKYGIFGVHVAVCVTDCECVCACVFGCEAWPDAVLGHDLRRIKGLAL